MVTMIVSFRNVVKKNLNQVVNFLCTYIVFGLMDWLIGLRIQQKALNESRDAMFSALSGVRQGSKLVRPYLS